MNRSSGPMGREKAVGTNYSMSSSHLHSSNSGQGSACLLPHPSSSMCSAPLTLNICVYFLFLKNVCVIQVKSCYQEEKDLLLYSGLLEQNTVKWIVYKPQEKKCSSQVWSLESQDEGSQLPCLVAAPDLLDNAAFVLRLHTMESRSSFSQRLISVTRTPCPWCNCYPET